MVSSEEDPLKSTTDVSLRCTNKGASQAQDDRKAILVLINSILK
jgi:hypothetical protein